MEVVSNVQLLAEIDQDGNVPCARIDAVLSGVVALKYRVEDNVWRIVSKENDLFKRPQEGWGTSVYIPVTLPQGNSSSLI